MDVVKKVGIAIVAALFLYGAGFVTGWVVRTHTLPDPGAGTLEPVGPSETTPKPRPGTGKREVQTKPSICEKKVRTGPEWDWKYCGTSIKISHKETKEGGSVYTTIVCEDDCKRTQQRYKMSFTCPMPKHTLSARLILAAVHVPGQKLFDAGPGIGVGYTRNWQSGFGLGGEFAYAQGLLQDARLFQGSLVFKYTF